MNKLTKYGCLVLLVCLLPVQASTQTPDIAITTDTIAQDITDFKLRYIERVSEDPTDFQSWYFLAFAEASDGEVDEAAESLIFYWEFSPDKIEALNTLNKLESDKDFEFLSEAAKEAKIRLNLK